MQNNKKNMYDFAYRLGTATKLASLSKEAAPIGKILGGTALAAGSLYGAKKGYDYLTTPEQDTRGIVDRTLGPRMLSPMEKMKVGVGLQDAPKGIVGQAKDFGASIAPSIVDMSTDYLKSNLANSAMASRLVNGGMPQSYQQQAPVQAPAQVQEPVQEVAAAQDQMGYQDPGQMYDQDPNQAYYQDPNQMYYQDPNQAYYQDPNQMYYQDPNQMYYQDPSMYYQDPNQMYAQDPGMEYDPATYYQDPSVFDYQAMYQGDPRTQYFHPSTFTSPDMYNVAPYDPSVHANSPWV